MMFHLLVQKNAFVVFKCIDGGYYFNFDLAYNLLHRLRHFISVGIALLPDANVVVSILVCLGTNNFVSV